MRNWWGIAFGVVCGLFAAGIILLLIRKPAGDPVRLLPPPTPLPVVVHVNGSVNHPGVYTLPENSRVGDAIKAAGGAKASADLESANLAAFVVDGERIWVPEQKQVPLDTGEPQGDERFQPLATSDGLVDINTAGQNELESLPGIGPVLAQAIVEYRNENGPFTDIAEIQDVPGIGSGKFEQIMNLITVTGAPSD